MVFLFCNEYSQKLWLFLVFLLIIPVAPELLIFADVAGMEMLLTFIALHFAAACNGMKVALNWRA